MVKNKWLYFIVFLALASLILRILPIPYGNIYAYKYEEIQYTYQDIWYFIWSRGLEGSFSYLIYKFWKLKPEYIKHIFHGLSFLAIGKSIDELLHPFNIFLGEILHIILSIIFTIYFYHNNKQNN